MIDMANRDVPAHEKNSSLLTSNPRLLQYQNNMEINPIYDALQADQIYRNREMICSNNISSNQGNTSIPPEMIKQQDWIVRTREYETRKHLKRDAYYHASQEYVRLMKEDQIRQSFREKQRLTEDLEKQKRSLIEDLARDQQLKQDQYERGYSTNCVRPLHIGNNNELNQNITESSFNIHILPNGRNKQTTLEPRYSLPLAGPKDIYSHRRLQETNIISVRKDTNGTQQCMHSNINNGLNSLIPIIQEKEQQIKEMEEKLITLGEDRSYIKSSDKVNSKIHAPFHYIRKPEVELVDESKTTVPVRNMHSFDTIKQCAAPGEDLIIDVEEKEMVDVKIIGDETEEKTNKIQENDITLKECCEKVKTRDEKLVNKDAEKLEGKEPVKPVIKVEPVGNISDSESNLQNSQSKTLKKQRNKHKELQNKKEESSSDFLAIQNRLAIDLTGHNWLVERLMQEKKIVAEDISANNKSPTTTVVTMDTTRTKSNKRKGNILEKEEEGESTKKIYNKDINNNHDISFVNKSEKEKGEVIDSKSEEIKVEETVKVDGIPELETDNGQNLCSKKSEKDVTKTEHENNKNEEGKSEKNEVKSNESLLKDAPCLMSMLNPRKTNPQLSSSNRINPPLSSGQHISHNNNLPASLPTLVKSSIQTSEAHATKQTQSLSKITYPTERFNNGPPLLISESKSLANTSAQYHKNSSSEPLDNTAGARQSQTILSRRPHSEYMSYENDRNLRLMKINETTNLQHDFPFPSNYINPLQNNTQVPYSKVFVEERYNRKRPHDADEKKLIVNMEQNAQIRHQLDHQMSEQKNASEDAHLFAASSLPTPYRYNSQEQLIHATKNDMRVSNGYSRAKYMSDSPLFDRSLYNGPHLITPVHRIHKELIDAQNQYLKHDTPSSYLNPPGIGKRLFDPNIDRFRLQDKKTDLDSKFESHLRQYNHRDDMQKQLTTQHSRERESRLIVERRVREELQRSEIALKQHPYPLIKNVGNYIGIPNHTMDDSYNTVNERVRTVEDLRAIHMGLPIDPVIRPYSRAPQYLRIERLTEREKLALRDAEINNHFAVKHKTLTTRQTIHNAYLEHVTREKNIPGKILNPGSAITDTARQKEQMRLMMMQKQEEEKLREQENLQITEYETTEQKDLFLPSKKMPRFDANNAPRFFSHKISRTRDGSLDFGRSKSIDYNFTTGHPPEERSIENANKVPRSPQTYISAQPYKSLSQDEIKNAKENETEITEEKWKTEENNGKKICKICDQEAQFLCSGCRNAWYCSKMCQLSEWRSHSKTCAGVER